jgi:hypothetical protein
MCEIPLELQWRPWRNKYKLPKDQACIEANKNKWEEEKKKKSGSGSHSSGGKQYERSMFGNGGGLQKPSGSGVEKFKNMWHMYCGKGCGWNCTHTSAFMLLSLQIHLPFPVPCLSHILIIKGLQENNVKQDLFHLLLLLFLQLIPPLIPAAMTWSLLIRTSSWLSVNAMSMLWLTPQWLHSSLISRNC